MFSVRSRVVCALLLVSPPLLADVVIDTIEINQAIALSYPRRVRGVRGERGVPRSGDAFDLQDDDIKESRVVKP